jgi:hypothetical protein
MVGQLLVVSVGRGLAKELLKLSLQSIFATNRRQEMTNDVSAEIKILLRG